MWKQRGAHFLMGNARVAHSLTTCLRQRLYHLLQRLLSLLLSFHPLPLHQVGRRLIKSPEDLPALLEFCSLRVSGCNLPHVRVSHRIFWLPLCK